MAQRLVGRWTKTILSLVAGAGLFSASWGADQPGTGIGERHYVILTAEGKVEAARKGQADWVKAQTNQVLKIGDQIRTGMKSRATLQWTDLSVLRVDQLTTMEIAAPETSGGKSQLNLRSGATYFFSREKPREIEFRTPVASGAIRGTEFNIAVAEDGATTVTMLNGEAELTNDKGTEVLGPGEQGKVQPG